jgi:hypothetical protein
VNLLKKYIFFNLKIVKKKNLNYKKKLSIFNLEIILNKFAYRDEWPFNFLICIKYSF